MSNLKVNHFALLTFISIAGIIAVGWYCFKIIPLDIKNTQELYAKRALTSTPEIEVKNAQCPKCKGEMEKGILAYFERHEFPRANKWGTDVQGTGNPLVPYALRESRKVNTYRCKKCGYLEFYANYPIDNGEAY